MIATVVLRIEASKLCLYLLVHLPKLVVPLCSKLFGNWKQLQGED